jgi:hypothetical protein
MDKKVGRTGPRRSRGLGPLTLGRGIVDDCSQDLRVVGDGSRLRLALRPGSGPSRIYPGPHRQRRGRGRRPVGRSPMSPELTEAVTQAADPAADGPARPPGRHRGAPVVRADGAGRIRARHEGLAVPGRVVVLGGHHPRRRCYQQIGGSGPPKAEKKPLPSRVPRRPGRSHSGWLISKADAPPSAGGCRAAPPRAGAHPRGRAPARGP